MNEPPTAAELPPLLSPQAVLDARVRQLLAELTSLQENI